MGDFIRGAGTRLTAGWLKEILITFLTQWFISLTTLLCSIFHKSPLLVGFYRTSRGVVLNNINTVPEILLEAA